MTDEVYSALIELPVGTSLTVLNHFQDLVHIAASKKTITFSPCNSVLPITLVN